MAVTKRFECDFTTLRGPFTFTLIAPNGDSVGYPGLSGEQAEQLWRMWETAASLGWDVRWRGDPGEADRFAQVPYSED